MPAIDQLTFIRQVLGRLLDSIPEDDLFRIPDGFVNHIAWNGAHLVATQQALTYGLSGVQPFVPQELIDRYRKGTHPGDGDAASYRAIMEYSLEAPARTAADFAAGKFAAFSPYETSQGFRLSSIEEAISFNNFHEGIHLGYILALRKALA